MTLNIVIPMAGAGSRFSNAGYKNPKPLIDIHGIPMIQLVINNLRPSIKHRFIFICRKAHLNDFNLGDKLKEWGGADTVVLSIDEITEGAACTVLKAESFIDSEHELMIANCDQFVDISIDSYLEKINHEGLDGLVMTLNSNDPKWSYVSLDRDGYISNVVEKKVISSDATVGIYNFKRGRDFVAGANEMIKHNLRVNNEFYVAPVYNQLIAKGFKYGIFNIGTEGHGMYGLGVPADLEYFLMHPISTSLKSIS